MATNKKSKNEVKLMGNFSKKINAIIISMMLVLSFFCAEIVKFGTNLNDSELQKVTNFWRRMWQKRKRK